MTPLPCCTHSCIRGATSSPRPGSYRCTLSPNPSDGSPPWKGDVPTPRNTSPKPSACTSGCMDHSASPPPTSPGASYSARTTSPAPPSPCPPAPTSLPATATGTCSDRQRTVSTPGALRRPKIMTKAFSVGSARPDEAVPSPGQPVDVEDNDYPLRRLPAETDDDGEDEDAQEHDDG